MLPLQQNALWHAAPIPALAVIIPTYNRHDALLTTLAHLERQTLTTFEVVILDDGSTDATASALTAYLPTAPFPLTIAHQPNSGPARARNAAARLLRAPICVLIGDDIFASPGFLATHLALHQAHPEPNVAAIGLTRWAAEGQTVTPLMRWLDREGVQFAYAELESGTAPTWKHFYTSNLSLKTALLQANPFDEGFRLYGMEDIELGYRLWRTCGLEMYYLPGAAAEHLHPTTFARTTSRAIAGGRMFFRFAQLWPEHRRNAPRLWWRRLLLNMLSEPHLILPTLVWLTDQLTRLRCPNPLLLPTLVLLDRHGYELEAQEAGAVKV